MKIAHLIMAHQDFEHILRLVNRLSKFSDVYLHIDVKADASWLFDKIKNNPKVFLIENRLHCEWGGWNSVVAEVSLLKSASSREKYDRYVFLQGADYPIKTDAEIIEFYKKNNCVEFIRGCCCTDSRTPYLRRRCYGYWFYNNMNKFGILKRISNKIVQKLNIEVRNGFASGDDVQHKVYWGSAQWALTNEAVEYIIKFYNSHPKYNKWYYHSFPADELYFTTVIMNSDFSSMTTANGPEEEMCGLSNWRNLHYFEYLPGKIRIYNEMDYDFLCKCTELYVRKVTTKESAKLLDLLDKQI